MPGIRGVWRCGGLQAGGDLAPIPSLGHVGKDVPSTGTAEEQDRAGQRPHSDRERQPGLGRARLREDLVLLLLGEEDLRTALT